MKFKINKKLILDNIKVFNQLNINSMYSPVLQNIYISVNKERIEMIATNGFISSKVQILENFDCIEEGDSLVRFKILYNIVQKLDNSEIIIEKIDNSVLKIFSNRFDSNINIMDSNEFPSINFSHKDWIQISLKSSVIRDVTTQVMQSVSQSQEKGGVLSGVRFESDGDVLQVYASDSFRLSYLNYKIPSVPFKIIIDPSTLSLISENMTLTDDVIFYLNGFNLIIKIGNNLFASKVIEGEYPNISKIINSPVYNEYSVNKKDLIGAIERGLVLSNEKKPVVQLKFEDNLIKIHFKSVELGNSQETINAKKISGDTISLHMNAMYLISLLKVFEDENVEICSSLDNKPIILSTKKDANLTQLLLPIRSI